MRTLAWILLGWLGVTFWTALGSRFVAGHVLPDVAVMTVVFLAFRREPLPLLLASLSLGYLTGRHALAPVGLHEVGLGVIAVATYTMAGHLAASGALFFAVACAMGTIGYHLLLFALLHVFAVGSGFSSWWTAALVPGALATFAVAWLSHPWMERLELAMAQEKREGLGWH